MSRSVVVRLSMDAANYIREAQKAGVVGEDAMRKVEKSAMSADQAISQVGSTAGMVAAGGLATLFATGKAAATWESDWAGVTKTVDGTTQQLTQLEDELRSLARDTLPASHSEIAEVASAAGALGVATEDISSFTEQMVMLGEATDDLTADEAATAIAQFANVMQMGADETDNFAAALVDLGNNGASTEGQILALAARVAGAGTTIGATSQDVLALSAAMANLGIPAELGGGAMQRVLLGINTQVAQNTDMVEQYARIAGVSAQEFAQAWGERPVAAFDMLVQGLGRIRESGGDVTSVLGEMGIKGTQNQQVMLRMAGAGDGLTESLEMSGRAWEENTALIEEFANRAGTTDSQVTLAWNRIKDAGIEAGEVLLPIVATLAEVVGTLANAFGSLPDPVQTGAILWVAALTGSAGLVWAVTKTIGAVQTMRGTFSTLAETLSQSKTQINDFGTSAGKTVGVLSRMAGTAAGVLAVGVAIGTIGDNIGRIDPTNLERTLDAFSRGDSTGDMDKILDDLGKLESWYWRNDWLAETVTLGGLFGDTTTDKMQKNIAQVDAALAQMVESGERAQAALLFDKIVDETGMSTERAAEHFAQFKLAQTEASEAAREGAPAIAGVGAAADETADAVDGATQALEDNMKAMEEARQAALRAANAEVNWYATLDDVSAALKENGRNIDLTTEKGRANRTELYSLAAAWNDLSPAQQNAEGAAKQARRAFIDAAVAMGFTREEARGLADDLMEIPEKRVTKVTVDTDQARAAAIGLRDLLDDAARDRLSTVTVSYINNPRLAPKGTDPRSTFNADGSVMDFYASGGLRENHVAQIAPAGSWRVWAEPETGGEAYIPLSPSKRERSLDIWEETGRRLGAINFARGGIFRPDQSSGLIPTIAFPRAFTDKLLTAAELQMQAADRQVDAADKRADRLQDRADDARRAADQAAGDVASRLDLLRGQDRVRDLRRSLNAKGKNKITGLERQIAREELKAAERELKRMRNSEQRAQRLEGKAQQAEMAALDAQNALASREWARYELQQEQALLAQAEAAREEAERLEAEAAQFSWQWAMDEMSHEAGLLSEALSALDDQVRDAEATVDSWAQKMQGVSDSVTSQFAPALFEAYEVVSDIKAPESIWHAGFVPESDEVATYLDPVQRLEDSIAGLEERARLQERLFAQGMSGDAFAAYSSGGNDALSHLLDSGQVREFQRLYDQYAALSQSVGSAAGMYAYGSESAAAVAELKGVQRQQAQQTAALEAMQREITIWTAANPNLADDFAAHMTREAAKGAAAGVAKGPVKL